MQLIDFSVKRSNKTIPPDTTYNQFSTDNNILLYIYCKKYIVRKDTNHYNCFIMLKKIFVSFLFSFFIMNFLTAFAVERLYFNRFVADNAGVLDTKAERALNRRISDLQRKTSADIAVVTLRSLRGQTIEDAALEIGRKYNVGKSGKNNGVVFLVVTKDRKVRIEVGYGLEGVINDAKAGRILDEQVLPYFKQGKYQGGILRGTHVLSQEIASSYGVTLADAYKVGKPPSSASSKNIMWLYVIIFVLAFILPSRRRYGYGRRYSSFGSSFGGGSFGGSFGGGGGFGGGGASRGW